MKTPADRRDLSLTRTSEMMCYSTGSMKTTPTGRDTAGGSAGQKVPNMLQDG